MLLPLLVLAIPILDTTLVTIRRLAERRPVTQGATDHTSHRLVYYGLSETKAVALLALIAVALGATAVAYNVLDEPGVTALGVLVTFVLLVQFGSFLGELSRADAARRARRHAAPPRGHGRSRAGSSRCSSTRRSCARRSSSRTSSSSAARGTELQRGTFLAALPVVLGMTYVVFVAVRHLPPRLALRDARATWPRSRVASGVSRARRVRDRRGDADRSATSLRASSSLRDRCRAARRPLALVRPASSPRLDGGTDDGRRRVLVVGAGRAGRSIVRELPRTTARGSSGSSTTTRRSAAAGAGRSRPRPTRRDRHGNRDVARRTRSSSRSPKAPADRLDLVVQACAKAGCLAASSAERPTLAPAPTRAIAE